MQAYASAADVSACVVGFVLLLFTVAGFSVRRRPLRFQDPWLDLFCCGSFTATLCSEISVEFEGSEARIVKNQWNLKVVGVLPERRRESFTGGKNCPAGLKNM